MENFKHNYKVFCDDGTNLRQTWFTYTNRECLKSHILRFVRIEMTRLQNEGYMFLDVYESYDVEDSICIAGAKDNKMHISRVFVRRIDD